MCSVTLKSNQSFDILVCIHAHIKHILPLFYAKLTHPFIFWKHLTVSKTLGSNLLSYSEHNN